MQEGIPVFFHLGDMPCRRCRMWRLQHAASTRHGLPLPVRRRRAWPAARVLTLCSIGLLLVRADISLPLHHRFKISLASTPTLVLLYQHAWEATRAAAATGLPREPCFYWAGTTKTRSMHVSTFFVLTPLPVPQRLFLRVCKLYLAQTEL